jgi:hypothetical protein
LVKKKKITMRKISLLSFVGAFSAIILGFVDEAWTDRAPKRPGQHVALDAAVPERFLFFDPRAITESGRVFGALLQCGPETCSPVVAVCRGGEITALHEGAFANTANNHRSGGTPGIVER